MAERDAPSDTGDTRDLGGDLTGDGSDQNGPRANETTRGDDTNAPQDETMHPALQAFASVIPDTVGAKSWLADVTTRVNDWLVGREVADRSQAHAEEYTANVGKFKDGLLQMVRNDPTTVTLARDLVPQTVAHLMPSNMSGEMHDRIGKDLSGHIQNEIVNTAILSMADRAPVLARRMLESSVGGILTDDQKQGAQAYITAQSLAKQADNAAAQQKQAKAAGDTAAASTHAYSDELINKGTGAFDPSDGWASRLIADRSVAPQDKNALMGAYGNLQQNGDIAESNSSVTHDALKQMRDGTLSSADIFNAVGKGQGGLSMQDAHMLNGMLHDDSPEGRTKRETLLNALDDAKSKLAGQTGENGTAGARAFDNYGKWLMGSFRQGGMAGFNPDNKEGYYFKNVGVNQFAEQPTVLNANPNHYAAPERSIGSHFRGHNRRR